MIAILGGDGQVARALRAELGSAAYSLRRPELDLSHPDASARALGEALERHREIRAVINASAYTAVDLAEKEADLAQAINAEAPGKLAQVCKKYDIPFVHYSTDYVFDGQGQTPRTEDAPTGPLGIYGKTKLQGEMAVRASGAKHLVFRTSWVYDADGKNFLRTMLRLFAKETQIKVVADQWGSPTYAPHLAHLTLESLKKALTVLEFPSGTYHLTNAGETNWNDFARAILTQAQARKFPLRLASAQDILAIPSSDYPTPARRPLNSRLSLKRFETVFGLHPPSWQEGLRDCIESLKIP